MVELSPRSDENCPNAVEKWCSTGTTARDVEIHFSETRDFYGDEFELLWFAALDKSLTRARRT